jgi:hypothetical protein
MVISPKPDPKPGYRFDRSAPVPAGEFTAWMKDLGDTIEGKALEPISDSDFTFTLRHANGDLDGGMLALAPEPRVQFFGTAKSFEPTPSLLARMRAFAEGTEFMLGTGRLLPELLAKATQIRVRCLTLGEHDHPVDGAETTISDPKEIKELCDLFPAMEDGNTTLVPGNPQWTCRLEITLSDKRRLLVRFHLGKKPLLWHGMLQPVELESPAFIAKLAELQDLAERNGKAAREQAAWIREAKELDDVDALLTRAQSMVIVPIDDARSSNQGSSSGCMVPEEEMAGWIEDLRATIRGVPRAHLGDFRTNIGLTLSDGGTLSAQFTFLPEPRVQFYRLAKSFEPTPSLLARLRALKAPAQDPAQLIAFAENVEDMDKLLQQVKGITAVGGYIAVAVQDKGRVRPSHVFDARASVVIQDVNGWVTDLRASIRGETVSIAEGDGLRLNLVLTDGRVLTGTLMLSEPASIHLTNLPTTFAPTPSLLTRMQWLFSKAKEVQSAPDRPDFGVANNINDLPKIPADVKALRCPSPRASTVREQLHRFAALENLELVEQGLTQLPHGAIVAELAQLTTLRRLRLPGRMLDDDDANLLAAVPALTALRIDGGLKQLTERGMATLLRGKQAIEVVDVSDVAAVVRAAAAAGTVRRFAVFGDVDDATFAAIAALPGLEALGLGGVWCKDEHVAQLTATKLQELRLEYAAVTAAGLSELAKIATLRLLDLRRVHLPRADVEALQQTLPQVRIVAPWSPPGPPSLDDVPGATRK